MILRHSLHLLETRCLGAFGVKFAINRLMDNASTIRRAYVSQSVSKCLSLAALNRSRCRRELACDRPVTEKSPVEPQSSPLV